jgi:hypothetical protein
VRTALVHRIADDAQHERIAVVLWQNQKIGLKARAGGTSPISQ